MFKTGKNSMFVLSKIRSYEEYPISFACFSLTYIMYKQTDK